MSKFIDSSGMSSILAAIKNKFVTKGEVPNIWIGTAEEYKAITTLKNNNTLYFIKSKSL